MRSNIKYGRRKGQIEGSTSAPPSIMIPKIEDLRKTIVLSASDWDRINSELEPPGKEREAALLAIQQREELRQIIKDKSKNWSNTLVGQRQEKIEAKRIREEKDEENRKLTDIEEKKYQAQKRKEAIEIAKTKQYYQTDRVKKLHQALLLSEVLKERDVQVEIKQLKQMTEAEQENRWLELAQRDYEESILESQKNSGNKIRKNKSLAEGLDIQIKSHEKTRLVEIENSKLERDELLKLASQFENDSKRIEAIKRYEAKALKSENDEQIGNVMAARDVLRRAEEIEDEKCRVFATAKRKMMQLRKEQEKKLSQEKLEQLEKIRKKLNLQNQAKLDDEDERITRAVKEIESNQLEEEKKIDEKTMKNRKAIHEHRILQIKSMDMKKKEKKLTEIETLHKQKQADAIFKLNEKEKERAIRFENEELSKFQLYQKDQIEKEKQEIKEDELLRHEKNIDVLRLEEHQFQEYANTIITHCEKNEMNVIPIKKAAQPGVGGGCGPTFEGKGGIRPSYMVFDESAVQLPNYQTPAAVTMKNELSGKSSGYAKLGFVW